MSITKLGNRTFEAGCELIDVTSMHRPDTAWKFTDAHNHLHQWYEEDTGKVAMAYSPSRRYHTPTLEWVKDGTVFWSDDNEEHEIGHLECKLCRATVEPRYCADEVQQMVPGIRWYKVDGRRVTMAEFERLVKEAQRHAKQID